MTYSIKRDWHYIISHPGQAAQNKSLQLAGIKGYIQNSTCEICTKSKITASKGHDSLRISVEFAEATHMDLVGDQKSLLPTTTDDSAPNASWFLLAIVELYNATEKR